MATGGLYGASTAGAVTAKPSSESNGLYGNSSVFGGTYFEWFIFKVQDSQPSTPTGGSWDFLTNTGTPPSGWLSIPPSAPSNNVWVSIALVNSKTTSSFTWSVPGLFSFSNALPILSGSASPTVGVGQANQMYIQTGTSPQKIWFNEAGTWTELSSSSIFVDLVNNQTIAGTKTFSNQIQGSISGTSSNVTGTVAIANGGTGATTASGARTALSVASSGANSDITSLSGISGPISTVDNIGFNTSYGTTLSAGQLGWNGNNNLGLGMVGGNVVQHIGEDTFYYVKASSAITKGQLCMFTGAVGSSGVVTAAPSTGVTVPEYIMGIAAENIALNGFGLIQCFGVLQKLNTSAFTDGAILYYDSSVAGGLTSTYPSTGIVVTIAAVISASNGNGILQIRPSTTQRLTAGTGISISQNNTGATIGVISGTSGGVPYYSSASTLASSAALTANALVVGGGAGAAPSTVTTGSGVLTALANTTNSASGFITGSGTATLTGKTLSAEVYSTSASITAGTNAQGQGALTSDYNVITTAANNPSGVTLPTATTGRRIYIVNKGANPVNIYPATGGTIDALTINTAITLPVSGVIVFNASSTTQWYSSYNSYTSSSSSGTVTSVSWTGGLVSIANPTTTPSFTIAGTSGGIPYFDSASTWSSSSALVANAIMIGGGAGAAPSTTTTGTGVLAAIGNNTNAANGLAVLNTTGYLPVAQGGTGLGSGTSGGVLYYSATGTLASSAALVASAIVLGGGAGVAPATTTTGSGVVTAIGNAVNTASGLVTQTATLTSSALLLGGGSGTGISSTTTGTGVVTALGNNANATGGFTTIDGTATLTNKRIDPRVSSTTSASSVTPTIASYDIYAFTAQAATLTINAPTGTPVDGDKLIFRILDNGTPQTLSWNATYTVIGVTLPTTTTANKTTYVGCVYNANNTRWDVIAVTTQA